MRPPSALPRAPRPRGRACAGALVALALLLAPRAAAVAQDAPAPAGPAWWDRAWTHRCALTLSPAGPLAPHTASATVSTHGALRKDGADLRVVGPDGRPVGVEVLSVGPGDVATLLFEARDLGARYAAYWGCADPKDRPPAWTRDGGLVCEVRRWPHPFPVDTPEGVALAEKTATDVEGRVLRPKVFDGQNPAGPSRTYVATYRGFFRVPTAGEYELCTVSSDASILRVREAEVPLWSRMRGPHAAQRGRFRTRVALEAGATPLEYVHFVAGGQPQAAVVAIRKTDEPRWRVLWDADWVQPVPAEAGPVEVATGPAPADFRWRSVEHADVGGAYLVRVRLEAVGVPRDATCTWDFGDGRGGTGAAGEHVYVGRAVRPVRLRVTSSRRPASDGVQRVASEPVWTQLVPFAQGSERAWSAALEEAAAAGLAPGEVDAALRAADTLGSDALVRAVAKDAFARADGLHGATRVDVFLTLAAFFDAPATRDPDARLRALALAATTPDAPPAAAARAALAAAQDAVERGDATAGLATLDRLRPADLDEDGVRRAALARADALLSTGRPEEAARVLERVLDRGDGDARAREASRRARLHAVEAWLAAGDAGAAIEAARAVLADFPRERLRAEGAVLLADASLRVGEARRATVLLERAVAVEPDGAATPRALLLLARSRAAEGDAAGAEAARARLRTEFPWSPEAAEVARPPAPPR
ncbi:MAG: PKD domain-containing protein [Planctomycetes bacterium]|nr:PKD domain-containing protein [Planctomycetota bacterium]